MNAHPVKRQPLRLFKANLLIALFVLSPLFAQDENSVETLRKTGRAFASIAQRTEGAVVGIQSELKMEAGAQAVPQWPFQNPGDNLFDWFFRQTPPDDNTPQQPDRYQLAQGSGFIINPDGYIITNVHVVNNAESITVQLTDDQTMDASVIGIDPETDIALIKIDAKNLPTLELADSDKVEVGEWVLAVGNPFGLSHSVTAGIVSAKGRTGVGIAAYEDFLQTDAAINPGNSGGPLVNLDAQVIGMNTAIISRSGGNLGIGLAIPSNMVKYIYDQLLKEGEVVRGYLGVSIQNLTPSLAKSFGVDPKTKGVLIPDVTEGSAAQKAGIQKGDIIVSIEGRKVASADELRNKVALYKPGTNVKLEVLRNGQEKTVTVAVGKRPSNLAAARGRQTEEEPGLSRNLGLAVQNLSPEMAQQLDYQGPSAVMITQVQPGSLAAQAGLEPGMLITEVDRTPVKNTREFIRALDKAKGADSILLLVSTGQASQYVTISLKQNKE
ncbi:MAG: DegQ family serine endoprotease [Planctomycetaceae bacterium]|nr:DegQ family serine endoprotease [Planctomycetaceae bacterium]